MSTYAIIIGIMILIVLIASIYFITHTMNTKEYHESLLEELLQEKQALKDREAIVDEMIENERRLLTQDTFNEKSK